MHMNNVLNQEVNRQDLCVLIDKAGGFLIMQKEVLSRLMHSACDLLDINDITTLCKVVSPWKILKDANAGLSGTMLLWLWPENLECCTDRQADLKSV